MGRRKPVPEPQADDDERTHDLDCSCPCVLCAIALHEELRDVRKRSQPPRAIGITRGPAWPREEI
jgi:hypothetical protein